jgi:hypothetical protein
VEEADTFLDGHLNHLIVPSDRLMVLSTHQPSRGG